MDAQKTVDFETVLLQLEAMQGESLAFFTVLVALHVVTVIVIVIVTCPVIELLNGYCYSRSYSTVLASSIAIIS